MSTDSQLIREEIWNSRLVNCFWHPNISSCLQSSSVSFQSMLTP